MILTDLWRAIAQLGDARFRAVLWRGVALTLLILGAFSALSVWLIVALTPDTLRLPFVGPVGGISTVAGWAGGGLMLLMSVVLMVPVTVALSGLFLDQIAEAVEARHYPGLPAPRPTRLTEVLAETARMLAVMLVANLLALTFYILSGPLAPLLFWGLNGWLLGRDSARQVALRRLSRGEADTLLRRHRAGTFGLGLMMAVPMSLPLVNLVLPVIAVAAFTHFVQRLARAGASS